MKSSKIILPLVLLAALSGCAEQQNWQPTIDVASDPHANTLGNDLAVCRQLAHKAADQEDTVGEDAGVGLLGGAAGGALLGAITGSAATGAAIGAVTGGGLGLASGTGSSNDRFKHAYMNCMIKRGHPVIN